MHDDVHVRGETGQLFRAMHRAAPRSTELWWGLIVARGVLPAAFAVAMGALINAVQRGGSTTAPLVVVGVVFVAMQALGPAHDALSANLGARVSSWLHERLLEACVRPPGLAHLEDAALADRLSSAREFDLGLTGPSMTVAMPNIAGGFTAFAGGAAQALLLFGYRWWAPIVIGGAWLSTHVVLRSASVWGGRMSEAVMEQQRRADYAYRLTVHAPGAKEVRLFGLADWIVGGFTSLRRHLVEESLRARAIRWRPTWICIALITGANGLFFWSLGHAAIGGSLTIGSLVVFAQAAIGSSTIAFGEWDWWLRTTAQPVPLVLGVVDDMAARGALPAGGRAADGLPQRELRFDDVSFSYASNPRPVLRGFDLRIPAGSSMAIVGLNGAGKTTLAKLVCRFYDPTAGAILADGIDLRELDITAWRTRVAAVFQDYVRYELSLRDNVIPGGAGDDEIVRAALSAAQAEQLAPLDTIVSKGYVGGTDLSGGQWQRVALARAVAAVRMGAGVVILDEPTAQLDVRGEAEIFERLLEATRGCTTILISHRFSTVRRADRICVVDGGAVVEVGTHDELLAKGGRYQQLFELQASRFEDEDAELESL